jgi:hypothetical protein
VVPKKDENGDHAGEHSCDHQQRGGSAKPPGHQCFLVVMVSMAASERSALSILARDNECSDCTGAPTVGVNVDIAPGR